MMRTGNKERLISRGPRKHWPAWLAMKVRWGDIKSAMSLRRKPAGVNAPKSRHVPTVEVSPEELRSGNISDQAILEAIAESRQ